ncbi:hypothetical protein KAR91_71885 [Candidatus Pacearchaeota archaeon]|nr:hypothetical protein [Candidatus Pacearchaeota archaeon]
MKKHSGVIVKEMDGGSIQVGYTDENGLWIRICFVESVKIGNEMIRRIRNKPTEEK